MNDVFAVWKPKGPTSNAVLNQIRRIAGTKKVGHAGTLDPLASGVLVVGVREGTKKLYEGTNSPAHGEKEYVAAIKLGVTSTTDDEEGEKKQVTSDKGQITRVQIQAALPVFTGKIMQTPPLYSAVKIRGKEAYKHARAGKCVKIQPREVEIKNIQILKFEWPYLILKVTTGRGAYIRSLARDLGEKLGTGGYLADLERTRVGIFTKESALNINDLHEIDLCDKK